MKRLLSAVLSASILVVTATPANALSKTADRHTLPLHAVTKYLRGIPYREISVPRPVRTIILIRGGPDKPTVSKIDDFDRYLATRFKARIIKPAYYGSSERSAWTKTPSLKIDQPMTRDAVAKHVMAEVGRTYAGTPQAVREMRSSSGTGMRPRP